MKILNTKEVASHLSLTRKLIGYNFFGSLLLAIILFLIPNSFWTSLFSNEFVLMRSLFIYLLPGVLFFSISNIINHFLHAKGMFKSILLSNGIGLLTGLFLSLLLIPENGLIGACIAWSSGLLASMLVYIYQFKIISGNISENL